MKEMLSNPLLVTYNLVQVSNMYKVPILCCLLFCKKNQYISSMSIIKIYFVFQRTANGTNTESGVNAVLLVVVELIIGREQKSKKPNMVDKIVQETLEKRPLATHITVQVHTKRFTISYKKYFNTLKVRCNYHFSLQNFS